MSSRLRVIYSVAACGHVAALFGSVFALSLTLAQPAGADDRDLLNAVFRAAHDARRRALDGGGPTLIVARTMRMHGHGAHDDMSYVPAELLESWGERDPIVRQAQRLERRGVDVEAVRAEVRELIDEETEVALAMPVPSAATPRPVFTEDGRHLLGDQAPERWSGLGEEGGNG